MESNVTTDILEANKLAEDMIVESGQSLDFMTRV